MDPFTVIAAIVAGFLLVYLLIALLAPEKLQ